MDTGFGKIDAMLKGLRPGGYYLIGGRPAMGKSALAINIAMHVAVKEQKMLRILLWI